MSDVEQSRSRSIVHHRGSTASAAPLKKRVGRPTGDIGRVGKAQILAKMRQFMRENPRSHLQRKEIAEYVNVAPALISYYFPKQSNLILDASLPLVVDYCSSLDELLAEPIDRTDKIKRLIRLLIDFNFYTGYTLDYYRFEISRNKSNDEHSPISETYLRLNAFMESFSPARAKAAFSPTFLQSALWGQCKYVAQQQHLRELRSETEIEAALASLTDDIFRLFAGGVAGRKNVLDRFHSRRSPTGPDDPSEDRFGRSVWSPRRPAT